MTSVPPSGPDQIDLRLLSELTGSGSVGLPQAAWAVGIPQAEAAARLVRMAEAGLPLRLLVQGDPALLQQFLRTAAPQPGPQPGSPARSGGFYGPGSPGPPSGNQQFAGHGAPYPTAQSPRDSSIAPGSGPIGYPPVAPAEPDFAGPIGRPIAPPSADDPGPAPSSTPASSTPATSTPASPTGSASPQSLWGIPGTASWTDRTAGSGNGSTDPERTGPPEQAERSERPGNHAREEPESAIGVPRATEQAAHEAATVETTLATVAGSPPSTGGFPTAGSPQQTVGLSGERVTVNVAEVINPGNAILVDAGYRLDDDERAVLIRTTVANAGPAPHDTMPDLYLFLVDAAGRTLPKAPVAVAGHPAHRVGVAAGDTAEGWTIFLIDADVRLSGVRWCIRPDLADRTLTWSLPE